MAAEQVDQNDVNAVAAAENARAAAQAAIDAALPQPLTLAIVLKGFDDYCVPKRNLAMESLSSTRFCKRKSSHLGSSRRNYAHRCNTVDLNAVHARNRTQSGCCEIESLLQCRIRSCN